MRHRDSTPTTPQRAHPSPSNIGSPLSRHETPRSHSTPARNLSLSHPSSSQVQVLSPPLPVLRPLPALPSTGNVPPIWLHEHVPLLRTVESEPILAALIASRAPLAARHRARLRDAGKAGIDWEWYFKELTRRKMIYAQIADVITSLVRF